MPLFKGKAHTYMAIKLLERSLKRVEMRIRFKVQFNEMQFGFMSCWHKRWSHIVSTGITYSEVSIIVRRTCLCQQKFRGAGRRFDSRTSRPSSRIRFLPVQAPELWMHRAVFAPILLLKLLIISPLRVTISQIS